MTTDQMNPILRNIYEQPDELDRAHKIARLPFPNLVLDGPWMMLVQAMWFQLLSYRVAVVNDIEPGMFFEEGWIVK